MYDHLAQTSSQRPSKPTKTKTRKEDVSPHVLRKAAKGIVSAYLSVFVDNSVPLDLINRIQKSSRGQKSNIKLAVVQANLPCKKQKIVTL